ncbi:CCA tRNA nucleotidyltransferase [Candidatus Microgenomates bacterium]|nr:CCA tRNA nucleotidyltransferase [Candidatus Microgenomates bacterium]
MLTDTRTIQFQAALKVARLLNQRSHDAYLIGGAVRDIWLGHLPKDFDLVTDATPDQILAISELSRARYQDAAQAFGVTRVEVPITLGGQEWSGHVEVATYRRDIEAHLGRLLTRVEFASLAEDVQRRDFTINALALDLANDFLVDLVEGIRDLNGQLIRFIGQPAERIREDPLRVLRGIRFKNQLGFVYEAETAEAITAAAAAGMIEQVATERLADELSRMLMHPSRQQALLDLEKLGLLDKVLPEVAAGRGVAQPPEFHSEGDVWAHTLLAVSYLPSQVTRRLAWATLLHDIGKPPTYASADTTGDRIRFSEHYKVGAQLASQVLARLHFSKRFITDVAWMIEHHMGIDDLPKMRLGRQMKFMGHPAFADLLALHQADAHASWRGRGQAQIDKSAPVFPELAKLWQEYQRLQDRSPPSLKRDLGVDGQWLNKQFGLAAGPRMGKVLTQLEAAYLDGEISTIAQARQLASRLLAQA